MKQLAPAAAAAAAMSRLLVRAVAAPSFEGSHEEVRSKDGDKMSIPAYT
jgi:hypothetical protein